MDPKVYLLEIKGLEAMDLRRARYTVDVKLQRWESAARNLKWVGDVEECLKLIEAKVRGCESDSNEHFEIFTLSTLEVFLTL